MKLLKFLLYYFQYVKELYELTLKSGFFGIEPNRLATMLNPIKKELVQLLAFVVENIGVEPMTSCVQSRRSSQLS